MAKKDGKKEVKAEKKHIVSFKGKRKELRFPIVRGFILLREGEEISKDNYSKLPESYQKKYIKII